MRSLSPLLRGLTSLSQRHAPAPDTNAPTDPTSIPEGWAKTTDLGLGDALDVSTIPSGTLSAGWGRPELQAIVQEAASEFNIDPGLIKAVIQAESSGDPLARSPRGAQGLMQLMPATAQEMGVADPLDPRQNVRGGVRYLRSLLDQYDGDVDIALAAYNAGPGTVARRGGIPPIPETLDFIKRVRRFQEEAPYTQDAPLSEQPAPTGDEENIRTATIWRNIADRQSNSGGLRISYVGPPPSDEEVQEIWESLDPGGAFSPEHYDVVGGTVGSLAATPRTIFGLRNPLANQPLAPHAGRRGTGLARAGRIAGRGLRAGAGFMKAPLVAGTGAIIGEAIRQGQIPTTVGRFRIGAPDDSDRQPGQEPEMQWEQPSWFGPVEGHPRQTESFADDVWAAAVRGAENVLGETVAGALAAPIKFLGWAGQRTSLGPSTALKRKYPQHDLERLGHEMSTRYITRGSPGFTGLGPTGGSLDKLDELIRLSSDLTKRITAPYAALRIDKREVVDSVANTLGPKFKNDPALGMPSLDELHDMLDRFMDPRGRIRPRPRGLTADPSMALSDAIAMKKRADVLAAGAYNKGVLPADSAGAKEEIQKAIALALRDEITRVLPPAAQRAFTEQSRRTSAAIAAKEMVWAADRRNKLTGVGAGMLAGGGAGYLSTGDPAHLLWSLPVGALFHSPTRSAIGRVLGGAGRAPYGAAGRAGFLATRPPERESRPGPTIENARRLEGERGGAPPLFSRLLRQFVRPSITTGP